MSCKPIFSALATAFVLPLMACSPGQPTPQSTPESSPGTAPSTTPGGAPAAPAAPTPETDSHAKPTPGTLKTFADWTVGCDNTLRCTLASLLPEQGLGEDAITLNIMRAPGAVARGGGTVSLALETRNDQATTTRPPASFAVDGEPVALRDAAALAAGIANAGSLKILDAKGATLATLSLKGAAAALRYMDAQQGRAGSIDAIVAKGPAPSRAPTPLRPVIAAIPLTAGPRLAPASLTPAQIATMRKRGACDLGGASGGGDPTPFAPEVHALGDGKSLVILPCSTGAYNLIGALFIVEGAVVTPARTDAPAGFAATGAESGTPVQSVINGAFENGVLTSYAKGRGLGDCGSHESFVWDGTRFRLSEQADMGECRGNIDYITTWRAKVVR